MVLFLSHHQMVVYIFTKFYENILDSITVIERSMIFIGKISKGGVKVLFLSTLSDGGLYLYKFHENILDGSKL